MHKLQLPRMAISLVLAVTAVLALIGINEVGYQRSNEALEQIDNTTRTRAALNLLLQQMLDAETGSRGFLLTGDARYLEPYNAAVGEVGKSLDALRTMVPPGGPEAQTLSLMGRDIQQKLAEMALSVRMRQQGNEDAWKFVLMTDVGKQHMDAIRANASQLIGIVTTRMQVNHAQVQQTLVFARVGIGMVTLVALFAFYLYLRQTRELEAARQRTQAALAQERDQLEQQVRERTASLAELATHLQQVREHERGHLARELHDELGALLTAAKLDVARLKSRVGDTSPEVAQRLQHLTDSLNSGIALKRRIIEDLRPSALANLGLSASLEILAREFSEQTGVAVNTRLEPVKLDESRQLTVYRLVQESLTNISKYAQARQVQVSVYGQADLVQVSVVDDGRGFDAAGMKPSTHGLAGMRHRVEAAGGRLRVDSAAGRGTRVSAQLPQESGTSYNGPVAPPTSDQDPSR